MAKRRKVRVKYHNRISMYALGFLLLCIALYFLSSIRALDAKKTTYEEKLATLQEAYDAEELRTTELEEFKKYTQTKKYVEKIAKEQLGLVYEDEILFKSTH